MRLAMLMFRLGLLLPEWVYGRRALLDMSLMYLMINTMRKR